MYSIRNGNVAVLAHAGRYRLTVEKACTRRPTTTRRSSRRSRRMRRRQVGATFFLTSPLTFCSSVLVVAIRWRLLIVNIQEYKLLFECFGQIAVIRVMFSRRPKMKDIQIHLWSSYHIPVNVLPQRVLPCVASSSRWDLSPPLCYQTRLVVSNGLQCVCVRDVNIISADLSDSFDERSSGRRESRESITLVRCSRHKIGQALMCIPLQRCFRVLRGTCRRSRVLLRAVQRCGIFIEIRSLPSPRCLVFQRRRGPVEKGARRAGR